LKAILRIAREEKLMKMEINKTCKARDLSCSRKKLSNEQNLK
jgi:hypothetical protein